MFRTLSALGVTSDVADSGVGSLGGKVRTLCEGGNASESGSNFRTQDWVQDSGKAVAGAVGGKSQGGV